MPSRSFMNSRVSPPDLVPANMMTDGPYPTVNDGPSNPDRTTQLPMAPDGMETRVMLANRVTSVFQPDPIYAEQDHNKGGAPGSPGGAPGGHDPEQSSFISSQTVEGQTIDGGLPNSPIKLSYGASDMTSPQPTALPMHLKIGIFQNPNAAQTSVGIWASEGPMANTKYTSPAPWAAGAFIGG